MSKSAESGADWSLIAAAVLVALDGANAEWLQFPLSAPVHGLDWRSADPDAWRRFAAAPFLALLALALPLFALGYRRIGGWLLGGSLAALLVVPLYAWLVDATWFNRYIEDASEKDELQFFVNSFVTVPNIVLNQSVHKADLYQYLPDRLRIVIGMFSWGWSVCVAALLLIVALLRRLQALTSLSVLLPPLAIGVAAIGTAGAHTVLADFLYRQADQRLGLGDYSSALQSYSAAIEYDPTLGRSEMLMLNATRAYFQRNGQNDPFGQMYLAIAQPDSGIEADKRRVLDAVLTDSDNTVLGNALKRVALRKQAQLWVHQGLASFTHGDYGSAELGFRQALSAYRDWRHVHYFLARTLWMLKSYDESLQLLTELSTDIHNPAMRANVFNTLGDVYASAGRAALSRDAYQRAYALDDKANLWAVKGLSGT